MKAILYISIGASIGASSRWLASLYLNNPDHQIKIGTLLVNLVGALLIGILYQHSSEKGLSEELRQMLVIGFLGSLTTFSTFSLEAWLLLSKGQFSWAVLHPMIHVTGCLLLVSLGARLAQAW